MTFEEYVRLRGPALVRFARLITGDDHLAQDLCQEVLARAFVRWKRIRRTDRPDVYLRRMVVNARASWWRRSSNRETPTGLDDGHPVDRTVTGHEAPIAERDALWRQVRDLSDRQRAVVVLRYYEDLDDATIAEILGCSAVTVRTHAMRALAALRSGQTTGSPVAAQSRRAS
ncbi:MAG: SigE family RNA polymerase sigma factor [Actinocatenispora sp.]